VSAWACAAAASTRLALIYSFAGWATQADAAGREIWEDIHMRLVAAGLVALTLGGCVGIPIPGMPPNLGGVGGTGMTAEEVQAANSALQASQAAGAGAASRPGDEAMNCSAIEGELTTTMSDPSVKAVIGSMGARAQSQKDKIDSAMASGKQQQPTAEDARAPLASAADLSTIMPQLMRGQRLNELATAKNCAFLKGAN